MLIEVLVGAAISLILLVVLVGFLIRRAPQLFVAERLAAKLADDDGKPTRRTPDQSDEE